MIGLHGEYQTEDPGAHVPQPPPASLPFRFSPGIKRPVSSKPLHRPDF